MGNVIDKMIGRTDRFYVEINIFYDKDGKLTGSTVSIFDFTETEEVLIAAEHLDELITLLQKAKERLPSADSV